MTRISALLLLTVFMCLHSFAQTPLSAGSGAVDSPTGAMIPGKMALRFDKNLIQHDNRGQFWRPGVAYNQPFFLSANVYPTGAAEYIVSAGYGGLHNLLFGFSSCSPTTNRATLSGNVGTYPQNAVPVKDWQNRIPELMSHPKYALAKKDVRGGEPYQEFSALDSSAVSLTNFHTTDEVNCNEWVNVSVGYDGVGTIGLWINGIPSASFPFDGKRMSLYPFETAFYIGGSDHSNFNGWIRNLVYFEGAFPLDRISRSFYPERNFQSVVVGYNGQRIKSSLLANYSEGNLMDYSSGFEGTMHPGRLSQNLVQVADSGLFGARKTEEDLSDRLALFDFAIPAGVPEPNSVPAGATIFDSFSRPNTNASSVDFTGLGLTEVGGRQWRNSSHARVINGQVGGTEDYQTFYFDTENTAGKVCARRGSKPLPNDSYYELNVKVLDNQTKIGFISDPYGVVRFVKYEGTAYSPTVLSAVVRPPVWNKICIDYSESMLKATFDDGPLALRAVVPANFAQNRGVGLTMVSYPSVGTRWDWISVVPGN